MATEAPELLQAGRYQVRGVLGEGAQGATLDAVDLRTQRPVAVKRFVVRGARSWKDVELAEREARVLASLSHARLPAYVEHFEEDGALYLVMEKIEGEPLFRAGRPERFLRMSRDELVRMLREVGDVLDYLHDRAPPIVHRDVKPGNVIRRPDGSFALIDFGAVRDRFRPEGGSTVVGTFGYMAPEQFQGRAGASSDVYSLGMTAIVLLTGREPEALPHKGLAVDVQAVLGDDPLAALLTKMVQPDPDGRPRSIAPLLVELRAPSQPPPQPPHAPPRASAPPPSTGTRPKPIAALDETLERVGKELEEGISEGVTGLVRAIGEIVEEAKVAAESERSGKARGKRERRAERLEQRIERRVERFKARVERERERTEAWRRSPDRPRTPAPPIAAIALVIAELAVTLSTRVLVPTVLTLLSIAFGAPLRRAAESVERAGRAAVERLRAVRKGDSGPPLRVAPEAPPPEARVEPTPSEVEREAEAEAEADEVQRRRGASRR